ncbi:IS481 family transposase [Pseudomonas sp. B21-032]|uniref:IS481 family transposase n=1 Tax=Pseudomonas sp. B21-032 TaxID=2895483 RepID=UPI00215EA156|nr:IS481 family transposase [Pseudomonas sp. B21-032]UVL63012.1 IS481 family transposase [Pseudomonas sp. B21-032]
MPWNTRDAMSLKEEFVALALQPGSNKRQLCRRFGISPQTAYKWLERYQVQGRAGLQEKSRLPITSPRLTDAALEAEVVALRQEHPAWGGRTISSLLEKRVAPSTVTNVLHRHKLILPKPPTRAGMLRFEHDAPNDLWQMDFKGHFAMQQGRCHPLTVLDDHSRFNLAIQACDNERSGTVKERLVEIFQRYGLPARINVDNGAPWGSPRSPGEHSDLSIWIIRLGIRISFSRPYHPQTNGKVERFHRSLKAEVLDGRQFSTLVEAQSAFDRWREIYNHQRPHQALDYQVPMARYRASPWAYPQQLTEFEYGPDDILAKVYHGRFRFKKRYFRAAKGLGGQHIAIRPSPDGEDLFEIYFCNQHLRTIDVNKPDYGP